jgi:hypothetical protein
MIDMIPPWISPPTGAFPNAASQTELARLRSVSGEIVAVGMGVSVEVGVGEAVTVGVSAGVGESFWMGAGLGVGGDCLFDVHAATNRLIKVMVMKIPGLFMD